MSKLPRFLHYVTLSIGLWVFALYPLWIYYDQGNLSEGYFATCFVAFLYALFSLGFWLLFGIVWGVIGKEQGLQNSASAENSNL